MDILARLDRKYIKLTIVIISVLLIGFVFVDTSVHDQGIYLILFSLLYVFFPGLFFVTAIDKTFLNRFRLQALIIAFFAGFALLIPQYYLLNALGSLALIRFTPLVLAAVFAVFSVKNLKQFFKSVRKNRLLDYAFPFIALFAITAVACYVVMKSGTVDTTSAVHIDYSYHMGNVNILTRGGSLEDTRVMGMTFKYHYFMDLYYAVLRLVFPAEIWNCIFRYPILLISPIAATSIYSFANSKFKRPILNFIVTVFIIFFPSLFPLVTEFTPHMLHNFNNVGFAVPMAICLTHMLVNSADKKLFRYRDLIFIFLLTYTLTGTKGPFALVLLGTMFIFLIYNFAFERKFSVPQACCFIVMLAGFAIVWFTLLNVAMNGQNIYSDRQGLARFFSFEVTLPMFTAFSGKASDPAYALITVPLGIVECFGGAAVPFFISVPLLLIRPFRRNRKKSDHAYVFVTISTCVSIGGAYLLALGHNRLYFLMFAIPYIYLVTSGFVSLVKESVKELKKPLLIAANAVMFVTLCLFGASMVISALNPEEICGFEPPKQGEIDGVNWIRNNTDPDALIAINDPNPEYKFYYYSGFTERRFYLESYNYAMNSGKTEADLKNQIETNNMLFYSDESKTVARNLGIDYFVYYDTTGKKPEILEKNYELCYSNDCLRIYSGTRTN